MESTVIDSVIKHDNHDSNDYVCPTKKYKQDSFYEDNYYRTLNSSDTLAINW